jgi:nucleotide-binding universal stress UspA family protein
MTDHPTDHPTGAMPMRTIVAGVDGSPGGKRALRWAASRGAEVDGHVVAVHVLTFNREFLRDLSLDTITTWRRTLADQLAGPWSAPARALGAEVRTTLVEDETVAAGLLKVAGDAHADVIVLGAHGRGGLVDRLLGATTYTVAHRAHTPVVIIPTDWEPLAS